MRYSGEQRRGEASTLDGDDMVQVATMTNNPKLTTRKTSACNLDTAAPIECKTIRFDSIRDSVVVGCCFPISFSVMMLTICSTKTRHPY